MRHGLTHRLRQAGAEMLRRGVGYALIITAVFASSTFVSLNPSLRGPGALGTISTMLMYADLQLNDLCTVADAKATGQVVIVDVAPHRPDHPFSWPQPRGRYGMLLRKLVGHGARVVVFDIVFALNSERPEQDASFLQALRDNPGRAVLARLPAVNEYGLSWDTLGNGLQKAVEDPALGPGFGSTLSLLDVDSILRRAQVAWDQESFVGATTLAEVALSRAIGERVVVQPRLVSLGPRVVPLSESGNLEIRIPDYRAEGLDVSMDEVLEGQCDGSLFKDRIVVVIPPINIDSILVRGSGLQKRNVPGGYVVAATIDTLLQGQTTRRSTDGLVWVATAVLCLLVGLGLWLRPSLRGLLLTVFLLTNFWAAVVLLALWLTHVWIDAVLPWLAMVSAGIVLIAFEATRVRGIFARFLPSQLVDHALARGFEREHSKGTTSEATVVFVDLQGYTGLSEDLGGESLVALINELHETIGSVFSRAGGTIVDYMGDAQMIVFGVPSRLEDHGVRAVEAVLAIPGALRKMNRRLEEAFPESARELRIGIGVASGPVTWGFIGSYGHQEFAALGDTTNTAARLQSMTRTYEVTCLISESTYEQVKHRVETRELAPVVIRGKKLTQRIFELRLPETH